MKIPYLHLKTILVHEENKIISSGVWEHSYEDMWSILVMVK